MKRALLLSVAIALSGQAVAAQQAPPAIRMPDKSDDANEGINAVRVENEYKIAVPKGTEVKIWKYLSEKYLPQPPITPIPGRPLRADTSTEYFTDVYYDTPDLLILAGENGVRHRSRRIPGNPLNRKDGRELMQIKM